MKFVSTLKCSKISDDQKNGAAIRKLRESRNMSLRTLATKLGWTAPYVSDLERGRRTWSEGLFRRVVKIINSK